MTILNLAAAATSAVVAGVYANFTARVLPRLSRLPAAEAIATMQQFNRTALQPPFMIAFFGGAALGAYQVFRYVRGNDDLASALAAGAGAAHLAAFVLTIAYNVPRNERLDRLDPRSTAGADYWAIYLREWGAANSSRAVLAAVALGLGIASVVVGVRAR